MAMMPSASTSAEQRPLYDNDAVEQDIIDPDDGTNSGWLGISDAWRLMHFSARLDDMDDPLQPTDDRAPLTGNIQSQTSRSRSNPISQSYLTSTIPGEDRRAPTNTIDESVWQTLSRDLLAVWEKMRQVLWPKYLLGGMLQRNGGGIAGAAERGEASDSLAGGRAWVGRWPDAETVLQGGMSDGLRDWDLWYK